MKEEQPRGHGGKVTISSSDVGKMTKLHGFPKWVRVKKMGRRHSKRTWDGVVTVHDPTTYRHRSGGQRADSRPVIEGRRGRNWHARARKMRRLDRKAEKEAAVERSLRMKGKERRALERSGLMESGT